MSIPHPSKLQHAIIEEIQEKGGRIRLSDLYDALIEKFPELTSTDLQRRTPSGTNWWQGYVRFALDALKKKGQVVHVGRGLWGLKKRRSAMTTLNESDVTDKLMQLWTERLSGTVKAEMCAQISERIFGLVSLSALDETKSIFQQLWDLIDFDELCNMNGRMGVTGMWGKDTLLDVF